jgi:hypothetical protein
MITRTIGTIAGSNYLQWLPKLRVGIAGVEDFADTSALRITSCPDTGVRVVHGKSKHESRNDGLHEHPNVFFELLGRSAPLVSDRSIDPVVVFLFMGFYH